MNVFILDACALIAYFAKEKGAENIKEILKKTIDDSKTSVYMNKINLLEVYYDVIKSYDEQIANKMLKIVAEMPIKIIHKIDDAVFKKAGYLKSKYRISLADSIAIAESITKNGILITSDHHEFEIINQHENIKIN